MNWSLAARTTRAGAAVAVCLLLVSCEDFLEISDPSRFTDDALNNPAALPSVANGVEADLLETVADFAWTFGQMSDELIHTGTWNPDRDIDRGRSPAQVTSGGGYQDDMLEVRTAAQKAQERFITVMGEAEANESSLMARVVAVEAWANVYMGMYNCESPKSALGEIVPSVEMFKLAVPVFSRAATIARAANSTEHERWAIAGRARANLFAGNLNEALADARLVPDAFVYYAKYDLVNADNTLGQFAHRSRLKAAGLDTHHQSKVDTSVQRCTVDGSSVRCSIFGAMRDPYTQQLDQRLPFTRLVNELGADGSTVYYNQEKYENIDEDIVQSSGWEMRLIEAEVHMRQGNLVGAMDMINKVRANAGLLPVVATTQAKVQEHLLWERFAQHYLEGVRMYDLHRFGLVGTVLGTGRPTQYPLDNTEINLNPNTNGSVTGRCFPTS